MSAEPKAKGNPHLVKGSRYAAEIGSRGTAERERRFLERVNATREVLLTDAPDAARNLGNVVRGDAAPNTVGASTAILDRVGLGPNVHHDVELRGSDALAAIILQLDAADHEGT